MPIRQISLFLLAGGIAAIANVGARILYSTVLPLSASVVLACLTGMFVAFMLNRHFVFEGARDNTGQRAVRFVAVNAVALVQTLLVTIIGARMLHAAGAARETAETIAHVVGVMVPVFSSYVMHTRWTFSRKVDT